MKSTLFLIAVCTTHYAQCADTLEVQSEAYTIPAGILSNSGFFDKLEMGASIGQQKAKEVPSASALEEQSKNFPQNPQALIKWGREQLKDSETTINKTRQHILNGLANRAQSELLAGASIPKEERSAKLDRFKLCVATSLPLIKHLLGALNLGNHMAAAQYFAAIRDISGQSMADTQNGELICGNHLAGLSPRFRTTNRAQMISDEAIALSLLSKFGPNDVSGFKNALMALWLGLHPKQELNRLWKPYWQYLSVEILARKSMTNLSPEDFARSSDLANTAEAITQGRQAFEAQFSQVKLLK